MADRCENCGQLAFVGAEFGYDEVRLLEADLCVSCATILFPYWGQVMNVLERMDAEIGGAPGRVVAP